MKDFQVASPADDPFEEMNRLTQPPENEDIADKWRRIARLAVLKSAESRYSQVCIYKSLLEILTQVFYVTVWTCNCHIFFN